MSLIYHQNDPNEQMQIKQYNENGELTFALIQQCYQPVFDYTEQAPKTKMQTHSNSPAKPKP